MKKLGLYYNNWLKWLDMELQKKANQKVEYLDTKLKNNGIIQNIYIGKGSRPLG